MSLDSSNGARQLAWRLRRNEIIAAAIGLLLVLGTEMLHACCLPSVRLWTLRGMFIPFICIISLLAMWSSLGMQDALKARGAPHPLKRREECVQFLIETHDTEGMRLLKGIGMSANVYGLVCGVAIGLCVAVAFWP